MVGLLDEGFKERQGTAVTRVEFGAALEFGFVGHGHEGNVNAFEVDEAAFFSAREFIPVIGFAEAQEAFFGEGVGKDGAFFPFFITGVVLAFGFREGDLDIEDGRAFEDLFIEAVVDVLVATISHTACELDKDGIVLEVEVFVVQVIFLEGDIEFFAAELEKGMIGLLVVKLDIAEFVGTGIEAWIAEFFPQIIFGKFFPKPHEVIFKEKISDMEKFDALIQRGVADEVDQLGLSTTGTTIEKNVIKRVAHENTPMK